MVEKLPIQNYLPFIFMETLQHRMARNFFMDPIAVYSHFLQCVSTQMKQSKRKTLKTPKTGFPKGKGKRNMKERNKKGSCKATERNVKRKERIVNRQWQNKGYVCAVKNIQRYVNFLYSLPQRAF